MLRLVMLAVLAVALSRCMVISKSEPVPSMNVHVDPDFPPAGKKWASTAEKLCRVPNAVSPPQPKPLQTAPVTKPEVPNWPEPSTKIFDDLYFVGSKGVSSFALRTRDGIIITDAMWDYDVERSVVGGLKSVGLDPQDIKYVIVPHGHPDHYAGAQFLKDKYGADIVAPRKEIDLIESYRTRNTATIPSEYDVLVDSGSVLKLGDTSVTFYDMPGHTEGSMVLTFPVTLDGQKHKILIWSAGGATPDTPEKLRPQIAALETFIPLVKALGIDTIVENHGAHIGANILRENPNAPVPFLVGKQGVLRYLETRLHCDRAVLAALEARE